MGDEFQVGEEDGLAKAVRCAIRAGGLRAAAREAISDEDYARLIVEAKGYSVARAAHVRDWIAGKVGASPVDPRG